MTVVVVPRVVAACAAAPGGVPTTRRAAGTGLAGAYLDLTVAGANESDARRSQLDALVERWVEDTE